jgi:hypothetical protein
MKDGNKSVFRTQFKNNENRSTKYALQRCSFNLEQIEKPFKILIFILLITKVNLNQGVHYMTPYCIAMFYTSKLLDYSRVNITNKPCDT